MFIGIDVGTDGLPPPPTYYLTGERVLLYITAPDRATRWRIGQWSSLSVAKEEHDAGTFAITAPSNAAWILSAVSESAFDVVSGWEEFSFDVYIDGTLEWSGPIVDRKTTPGAAGHAWPYVTLTAETFTQHLPKRRANNTTDKSVSVSTDNADDIIRQALRNANGSVTPTGYPGGVSRADFGSFTMAVQADTNSAASLAVSEQDGNNTWLFVTHVAEMGDCYIYTVETSAGTFNYRVDYPYQENDRTAAIVLTPAGGTVTDYASDRTLTDLVNVAAVKGSGNGATQVKGWQSDGTSIAARGVFEGEDTLPGASSSTYTDTEATSILDLQGNPIDTLDVSIRSTAAARFVYHASTSTGQFGMRDQITVVLPQLATAATAIVRGWKIEQSGTGPFRESITLGDIRPSVGKAAALSTGWPGPFSAGGRRRNNSGT